MSSAFRLFAGIATLSTLLTAANAAATTQLFVDVPGIPGDATFAGAEKQIQGISYSFGITPLKASKYGTAGVCAPGSSKPVFSEFCVKKNADVASPKLLVAAAAATPFAAVTVRVFRSDAQPNDPPFVRWVLANAVVSSLRTDGDTTAAQPTEQVCFRFNRVQETTTRENEVGGVTSETAGFDACQTSAF
jgi:type VI protein secretion system component Hcp